MRRCRGDGSECPDGGDLQHDLAGRVRRHQVDDGVDAPVVVARRVVEKLADLPRRGPFGDLEQARSLPSRSMVVLLKAIEIDSDFMRHVAKEAKADLALLDAVRAGRN